MMTRSSSGTSAMSKRGGGQDSVGENEVGDVDHQGGDAVGATFISRTALERSPVSAPQSLVPEASHPPLVDVHASCDSPQWGVDSILAFPSHTSSTKMPHPGGGGASSSNAPMMEVHHNRNNINNNSAHVGASRQQTATATQPQRSAFERNLSICSQLAPPPQAEGAPHMQQRQAPSLHTSPMTGAIPTAITASKSLPPSLNSGFSASSLLEIQKHIQAAQMILHNEWMQNKNLVVVVDTATPIIRTPVGRSPSGGGGGAGESSGTSFPRAIPQQFLEDNVSFSCMFPPALQLQQPHEQQIAATAFVAFGPQNSDANSGIHKPLPSSSSIGRRGGSVSSGVDAVLMFAPTSSTAALPSWPLGGQPPAVNDDFHHHGGLSVASFVDDMLSSTTTTTVRAGGGGGTNKSAASHSLVSSARDESRAPEVQSVRQAGLHLTTTTLTKSMDEFTGNKIVNQYLLLDDIGEGACGRVKLAYSLERNITVAVKVVPKIIGQKTSARLLGRRSTVKEDTLRHEISLMKRLRHPNLVSLFEVIDDPNAEKLYLVMRFADKGSVGAMREDLTC
ncbi:protein kinase, putative, partial [Bodo saltans]